MPQSAGRLSIDKDLASMGHPRGPSPVPGVSPESCLGSEVAWIVPAGLDRPWEGTPFYAPRTRERGRETSGLILTSSYLLDASLHLQLLQGLTPPPLSLLQSFTHSINTHVVSTLG